MKYGHGLCPGCGINPITRKTKNGCSPCRHAQKTKNYLKYVLQATRTRSKQQRVLCTLRLEDMPPVPSHCPILGIELIRVYRGIKGPTPNSPSLDRRKPELGYVKGNVRWISNRANLLKNDATLEEIRLVAADIERIYRDDSVS